MFISGYLGNLEEGKLVDCRVFERVKRGTQKWIGHVIKMKEDNFVKSTLWMDCGRGYRWRPPVNWTIGVYDCWSKRVGKRVVEFAGSAKPETILPRPPPSGRIP